MATIHHGCVLALKSADAQPQEIGFAGMLTGTFYPPWTFGYMFSDLQDDPRKNLLDETAVEKLRSLGTYGMEDPGPEQIPGVPVPEIYTFLGQFIDHDITLELGSKNLSLTTPVPIDPARMTQQIVNSRSPNLDLDNIYGPDLSGQLSPRDPYDSDKLRIDDVNFGSPFRGLPPGKDIQNDLPRDGHGTALIGDPRDDENVVLAQLHVAFLRAHNALVDRGLRFGEARKLLRQHYQWIVLDDFLERIADPNIVKKVRYRGPTFFNVSAKSFFMPLEFSVAAFRFGHSKVRDRYFHFSALQVEAELDTIFRNAGHSLSSDWVIDWSAFLDTESLQHFPRPIDTALVSQLRKLGEKQIGPGDPERNLAVRNLLRGYILRLPTGQAVAGAMASQGILPLTPEQILSVATSDEQTSILRGLEGWEGPGLLERTPLWFYILAEASYYSRGHHLGPVGSTIVAEVLIGILRNSSDSIMSDPHWRPTLGATPGKFDIEDLLKLAGVF